MMSEVDVIASVSVAVTNLKMASTLKPNFTAPSLPPISDCLDLCVQPVSPFPSLLLPMNLPHPPFLPAYMKAYMKAKMEDGVNS